jgi:predicted dehydrogenase
VLCEKPLVTAADDLDALLHLAAARGRTLQTVHNWHHAPIVRRTGELVRAGAIGRVTAVEWRTLRTQPARTSGDAGGANWRLDPAVAGGGVLTDHGWHVGYVVASWIGGWPTAVEARLETRRHTALSVEDTATVRLTFPGATADILLTWAAAARENWACVTGTEGAIELADDTLVLHRGGATERWPCPPALSAGSTHPDWFAPVAASFVEAVAGGAARAARATNVAEAVLCLRIETLARESSRRGGVALPLAAPADLSA